MTLRFGEAEAQGQREPDGSLLPRETQNHN